MQFFSWIADNWQAVCAWATGIYFTYHLCRGIVGLVLALNSLVSRVAVAEKTLTSMAINHLPHLQLELERNNNTLDITNKILEDMRDDLQKVLKLGEEEEERRILE